LSRKIPIAQRLRAGTSVTLKWIAAELQMETCTHMANRLQQAKGRPESENQNEFNLVQVLGATSRWKAAIIKTPLRARVI